MSVRIKFSMLIYVAAMGVLILDAKTAMISAQEAVELCLRTVIPSLFPFIFLSVQLTGKMSGFRFKFLRPLGAILGIPAGAEPLLVIGLLGGYPVGAQAITQAYGSGCISRENARRMLGFCNNAGPSFLFGILAPMFSSVSTLWILWLIHILSALITGILLPRTPQQASPVLMSSSPTPDAGLNRALRVMASICGWIILFRVILNFANKWFLWAVPDPLPIMVCGFLELTNGCLQLNLIPQENLRFILCSVLLATGGFCVAMQTVSVTIGLGTGYYFPGKLLHSLISFLLALMTSIILYPGVIRPEIFPSIPIGVLMIFALVLCLRKAKNNSSNFLFSGV